MARPTIRLRANLDDRATKTRLMAQVGALSGDYDVSLEPKRDTRSNQQSRWYFGCICRALADYLSEQDYDVITVDAAHSLLKARFLAVTVTNKRTGEVLGRRVRSTTELTTAEMAEFCERCRAWLADFFNIVVPDPDPAWAAKPRQRREAVPA